MLTVMTYQSLPAWALMWIIAVGIFVVCKALTWWQFKPSQQSYKTYKAILYLFFWPGMDPATFVLKPITLPQPALKDWGSAALKFIFGSAVFFGAAWYFPENHPMLKGWLGMIGLVFILHFGTFHLLALLWRKAKVQALSLFNKPVFSKSVGDFWGDRWNRAFRDLSHNFIYKPFKPYLGSIGALFAVFLASGLVHESVISVPAGGGYGLPTMYFLIQAVGIVIERSKIGQTLGLQKSWRGWVFTLIIVAGPVYYLFHPLFVKNVILPFMKVMVIS